MKQTFLPAPELAGGRASLVLAGFSGTGKSSVGALVGERLGMPFVDLDQVAVGRSGRSLPELFQSLGESHFRELEGQLLSDAARLSGTVIATGGGAVLHSEFAVLAESSVSVVLTATPAEIEQRVSSAASRPLLESDPGSRIRELLAERAAAYSSAGQPVSTSQRTIPEVATLVAERYRIEEGRRSRPIIVAGPQGDYQVVVGTGILARLESLLRQQLPRLGRVIVVSDKSVANSAGALVTSALRRSGLEVISLEVGQGEASKQIGAITDLWDAFQSLAVDRGDLIVGVAGGAGLDAIGFAAATWGRGTPWAPVPTTILAMVDASIGGKVAIDRDGAKNAVGAFHHPVLVVCDLELLATLPPQVARDGLAEVVKSATLASPLLLDALVESASPGDRLPTHLGWLVEQTARIKGAYVAADADDQGVRQSLNLGHTYAHGLEAASGYRISHGRAVAVGLLAAAQLGVGLGLTDNELPGRLGTALGRIGLLDPLPDIDRMDVREALLLDKKRRGGEPAFVVPTASGATLLSGIDLNSALEPLWPLLGIENEAELEPSGAAPDPEMRR